MEDDDRVGEREIRRIDAPTSSLRHPQRFSQTVVGFGFLVGHASSLVHISQMSTFLACWLSYSNGHHNNDRRAPLGTRRGHRSDHCLGKTTHGSGQTGRLPAWMVVTKRRDVRPEARTSRGNEVLSHFDEMVPPHEPLFPRPW